MAEREREDARFYGLLLFPSLSCVFCLSFRPSDAIRERERSTHAHEGNEKEKALLQRGPTASNEQIMQMPAELMVVLFAVMALSFPLFVR